MTRQSSHCLLLPPRTCAMACGRPWTALDEGPRLDISSDIFCAHLPPSPPGLSVRDLLRAAAGGGGGDADFIKAEQQPGLNCGLKFRLNPPLSHTVSREQGRVLVAVYFRSTTTLSGRRALETICWKLNLGSI